MRPVRKRHLQMPPALWSDASQQRVCSCAEPGCGKWTLRLLNCCTYPQQARIHPEYVSRRHVSGQNRSHPVVLCHGWSIIFFREFRHARREQFTPSFIATLMLWSLTYLFRMQETYHRFCIPRIILFVRWPETLFSTCSFGQNNAPPKQSRASFWLRLQFKTVLLLHRQFRAAHNGLSPPCIRLLILCLHSDWRACVYSRAVFAATEQVLCFSCRLTLCSVFVSVSYEAPVQAANQLL